MQQLIAPNQTVLGSFPSQSAAEMALQVLQTADISIERIAILPAILQPNPPIEATEAKRGAAGGAIAGTFLGLMIGGMFGYITMISPQVGVSARPNEMLIGLALLGSGIGAAGASLIGGLSGFNVSKAAAEPETLSLDEYILVAEEISAETIGEAKKILAQLNERSI